MKLNQFEKELKEIMNKYEKPRPFVCEGNPLESEIFIVGVNAATEMKASFWDFWIEGKGFNKEECKSYLQEIFANDNLYIIVKQ